MGFGLPLALLGLVAIGVPIAIHLMRNRDLPRVVLPTVALLGRASAESRQKLRLRDRVLLSLRALALLALALGVADPYVVTRAAFDDGRRSSLAIVLDDSMSMYATDGEQGRRIDDARELVLATLDALPEDSEAVLVLAGRPARVVVTRDAGVEAARHALRLLPDASARGTDLAAAVDQARRALAGARFERRLMVVSDFAAHASASSVAWPERGIEVALRRVGPDAQAEPDVHNAAVVDARGAIDPTLPDQRSVQIVAHGLRGPTSVEVRGPDGAVLAEASVGEGLATGDALRHTLHVPAQPTPFATVRLAGADDVLPLDDVRAIMLEPPSAIRVLLVDGDPHPTPTRDEVAWFARALDTSSAGQGRTLRHRIVDPDRLAREELTEVDVVVLANTTPSGTVAARLAAWVRAGGGLLVTGGERLEERALMARLGELLPAHVEASRQVPEAEQALTRPEGSPLPSLEPTRARRIHPLDPRPGAEVLAHAGGIPVLVRGRAGEGQVAILGTTLDDAATDLPYFPAYVALATELTRGLAGATREGVRSVDAGSPVSAPPSAREIRLPSDERVPVRGATAFRETDAPGIYRWLDGEGEVVGRFLVHAPGEESDLQPAALPELRSEGDTASRAGRTRRPIGRWFFLLAGALLFAAGAWRERRRPAP